MCEKCHRKDPNDATLEFFIRFRLRNLLLIEEDNLTRLYRQYPGLTFTVPKLLVEGEVFAHQVDMVNYFFHNRLTFGVGFNMAEFPQEINAYLSKYFVIPILHLGKMWQLMSQRLLGARNASDDDDHYVITEPEWLAYQPKPLECLICRNYPFGVYPGNFIIGQNVLFMKAFIWTDKSRLHIKETQQRVIMYQQSKIISWPFLWEAVKSLSAQDTINHLGNMAFFTSGEIFPSFIDMMIKKIRGICLQNDLIQKFKDYRRLGPSALTPSDVLQMYTHCRKPHKTFNVHLTEHGQIRFVPRPVSTSTRKDTTIIINNNKEKKIESLIIRYIESKGGLPLTSEMVAWFGLSKTKVNVETAIVGLIQMVNRGEIDVAISQTKPLNKEYVSVNEASSDVQNKKSVDVYRIGRFNKNAETNYYTNLCSISCGVTKLLPRDSKTPEPRRITRSEIGFIDLLNTTDSPRNCGLVLECVLDVIVSSPSLTVPLNTDLLHLLRTCIGSEVDRVWGADTLRTLDPNTIYLCANQQLFSFPPRIPAKLDLETYLTYVAPFYGRRNYFRMTQYVLKVRIPCIELIEESDNFWVCTSTPKSLYKVHTDGLLYTSREMEAFEEDAEVVERHLPAPRNDNDTHLSDFLALWIGRVNRNKIRNIFGPSVRATPVPNIYHLPRVSHACSSAKHAIGMVNNTDVVGSLHQKSLIESYYCQSSELLFQPGFYPLVLIAGGLNNQEDGILVKKSSIERGLFMGNTYETTTLKINYGLVNFSFYPIEFHCTLRRGDILRRGQQIGWFKNIPVGPLRDYFVVGGRGSYHTTSQNGNLIENFSQELKLDLIDPNGGRVDVTSLIGEDDISFDKVIVSVVWVGKRDEEAEMDEPEGLHRCETVSVVNVERMHHIKFHMMYATPFQPTVGDKLQTPTSQKGVITQLLSDQDTPFVKLPNGECVLPDLIINPHFMKRQSLDVVTTAERLCPAPDAINDKKNRYLGNCFSFSIAEVEYNIEVGKRLLTGPVMNPGTGLPFLQPVLDPIVGEKYYYPPRRDEFMDESGFVCVRRSGNQPQRPPQPPPSPHRLVMGSIYVGNYFCVNNHHPSLYYSKSNSVLRTEFTGTPVKGKGGGFSIGPQEQLSLSGIGAETFKYEITQLRSDYTPVTMHATAAGEVVEEEVAVVIPGSHTFLRGNDELNLRDLDVSYDLERHTFTSNVQNPNG